MPHASKRNLPVICPNVKRIRLINPVCFIYLRKAYTAIYASLKNNTSPLQRHYRFKVRFFNVVRFSCFCHIISKTSRYSIFFPHIITHFLSPFSHSVHIWFASWWKNIGLIMVRFKLQKIVSMVFAVVTNRNILNIVVFILYETQSIN